MSENNKGRFVQISNFRNVGVSELKQDICINRSIENDYIGNLVLLIGPNNSGKSNVLDAMNILNSNASFSYSDLPYSIKNNKQGTFIRLYDDADKINELLQKSTNGEKVPSKYTFSTWIENVKKNIDTISTKYMRKYGYNDKENFNASTLAKVSWNNQEFNTISQFLNSMNNWTLKQFINDQWWKTNSGIIKLQASNNGYYGYQNAVDEPVLSSSLVLYLNELIKEWNDSQVKLITKEDNQCDIKFLKYENWKIDNSFFKVKYDGEWNEFFTNLLSELGISQNDIRNGISGKQRYYDQKVSDGLKQINDCFNSLFKASGYVYEFDLFFNEESISFEINLVKQDNKDKNPNKIIPLVYDEQSTGFKYFFNLYFGLLIGQNNKLKSGDIVLMDEPGSNLHVAGIIELRSILKQFTQDTGISIILSTHSPFLVDFDYLDEIRLIDRIDGIVNINNYFQFNSEQSSNSLQAITNALATYPNSLIKYNDPIFILVEGITDYNYLTGYKLYKINQINKEIESASETNKAELQKLLHDYEIITFMPFNGLGQDETDFKQVFKSIDDEYHQRKYKFLIDGDEKGKSFKDKYKKQTFNLTDLVPDLLNVKEENRTIESLIDDSDKQAFSLVIDGKDNKHSNNSATFKYAMIKEKANEKTYQNFSKLFDNLIKQLNNK